MIRWTDLRWLNAEETLIDRILRRLDYCRCDKKTHETLKVDVFLSSPFSCFLFLFLLILSSRQSEAVRSSASKRWIMAPIRQFLASERKRCACIFFCCWRWIWEGWKKNKKNQTLRRKINGAPPFPGPCARKKTNRISHPCGKRKRLAWNVKENSVKTQSTTRKLSVQRMGHLVASSNELITVIIENNHFTISRSSLVPKNFK